MSSSALDSSAKVDILFKKYQGYPNTANVTLGPAGFTKNPAIPYILGGNVYAQEIPNNKAPTTSEPIDISYNYKLSGLLESSEYKKSIGLSPYQYISKYENLILTPADEAPDLSFYFQENLSPLGGLTGSNLLTKVIPSNYAPDGSYKVEVKTNDEVTLTPDKYILDRDAGLLTFYGATGLVNRNIPPRISFWRYEGTMVSDVISSGGFGGGSLGATGADGKTGATGFISINGINYSDYVYWDGLNWKVDGNKIHIGEQAGYDNQQGNSIAIGSYAGQSSQQENSIAIGSGAGYDNQQENSIAIGSYTGQSNQQGNSIAIGSFAGFDTQKENSIAIGVQAAQNNQQQGSIAIGSYTAIDNQGPNCIAIGNSAGQNSQGGNTGYSIAIGYYSGNSGQAHRSIVINATEDTTINGDNTNALYINPIRNDNTNTNKILTYNTTTKEIVYSDNTTGPTGADGRTGATGHTGADGPRGPTGFISAIGTNYGDYVFWNNQITPNSWAADGSKIHIGTNAGQSNQGPNSVAIGLNAGQTGQGSNCVAIGIGAGQSNQDNMGLGYAVAIGLGAGQNNQKSYAIAFGTNAGQSNQEGSTIAIGYNAGQNTQVQKSIAVGFGAGQNNQKIESISIGTNAGQNTQNAYSIAIGSSSGNTGQGSNSIALGYAAGNSNQGVRSVAIGDLSGNTLQGINCIAIGNMAGQINQDNEGNGSSIAIGTEAGKSSQKSYSIALGSSAGQSNQKWSSVAIGPSAGNNNQGTLAVAIGANAGNTGQGDYSITIGNSAGQNTQEQYSVAIGHYAGFNEQKNESVAIGREAGASNQGSNSIAIGKFAGLTSQGGNIGYSVAIGNSAGQTSQSEYSVAIGNVAGQNKQNDYSVAIGHYAGFNEQKNESVAIGREAGASNQGSNSIAIGKFAGLSNQGGNTGYSIAIGNSAGVTNQPHKSIIINAGEDALNGTNSDALYINPIRNDTSNSNRVLTYNSETNEVVYSNTTNGEISLASVPENAIISKRNGTYYGSDGFKLSLMTENFMDWFPVSDFILSGIVYSIVSNGSNVYVGGSFDQDIGGISNTKYIARYNTLNNTWSALGSIGLNGKVNDIVLDGNDLYVGGAFTSANGIDNTARIARYNINENTWYPISGNGTTQSVPSNGEVRTIFLTRDIGNTLNIFIGGTFTSIGSIPLTRLAARWNGSSWVALNETYELSGDYVNAISFTKVFNPVYIVGFRLIIWLGGLFNIQNFASNLIQCVASPGSTTLVIGGNPLLNGPIDSLYSSPDNNSILYIGGNFSNISYNNNNIQVSFFAIFDNLNNQFITPNNTSPINGNVRVITSAPNTNDIYIGSSLLSNINNTENQIVKYNKSTNNFYPPESITNANNNIYAIDISTTANSLDVYTGGNFSSIGGYRYVYLSVHKTYTNSLEIFNNNGITRGNNLSIIPQKELTQNTYSNSTIWYNETENNLMLGKKNIITIDENKISIGDKAGWASQGFNSVAIGIDAGRISQGSNAIAIGAYAGKINQSAGSIVLNASGVDFNTLGSGFYVKPIRDISQLVSNPANWTNGNFRVLQLDMGTNEIVWNGTKTFVINHPLDEKRYLVHACLEGPEAGVYYRGTGIIPDNETETQVDLPYYVSSFTVEPTAHITPIYNGRNLRVLNSSIIENNSFKVYGEPGPFNWIVYAKRENINVEPLKSEVKICGDGPYKYISP
jgi:hypothetical protein